MQYKCQECNDTGSRDKLGTYLDCNACDTATMHRDLNDFVKSLGHTHPEDVALAIHQRALAMAPKQEAPEPVAQDCGACLGSGWVSRDPDIGTEQECFSCDGTGKSDDAAPAAANGALPELPSPALEMTDLYTADQMRAYGQACAAAGPGATLVKSLDALLHLVDEFGIKSGVCCCGDDMARHSNPMHCGHSPVDSGEYYSAQTIEVARAALSGAKGN